VIAGEYQDLDLIEARRARTLPQAQPGHRLFEPAKAARRLGQCRFAAGHLSGGFEVTAGKVEARGAKIGKRGKARHLGVDCLVKPPG